MTSAGELKMISYRGGIVHFALPAAWREEYDPDGGATFFEDRPDSGTLRLNVLSFTSKDVPAETMAFNAFPKGSFEMLSDGLPLRRSTTEAVEAGHKLHLHSWEIAVPVPPHSIRIVAFRHTIIAEQEKDPKIVEELRFIERSVRAASFSRETGTAGEFIQK